MSVHHGIRIDGQNALRHDIDLVPADRIHGRDDLAVQVREHHLVIVDQVDLSYPASGQSLHDIAPYTADAEDGDPGRRKLIHCRFPQQHPAPGKSVFHMYTSVPMAA